MGVRLLQQMFCSRTRGHNIKICAGEAPEQRKEGVHLNSNKCNAAGFESEQPEGTLETD